MAKDFWCIREPDDRCIDCSPDCSNSDNYCEPDEETGTEHAETRPQVAQERF